MAKAKKPASGSKKATQTPKADVAKPVVDAAADAKKADVAAPSKVSQAAAAKASDKTTVASKSTPAAKSAKATDAKKVTPSTAKPAEAKAPAKAKPEASKTAPASTPKASETKSEAKPVDTKEPVKPETKPAPTAETQKSPVSEPPKQPEPTQKPEKSRSVFLPLVFGGVIAGGLGFAAAEMNVLNIRPDTDALRAETKSIKETLTAQEEQIAAFAPADLSGVEGSIAEASETLATLETRLSALENRPVVIAEDGTAALSQEFANALDALKTSVEAQKAEVEAQKTEVAAQKAEVEKQKVEIAQLLENALSVEEATANSARAAAVQTAAAKLIAALGSGEPYAPVLEDLSAAGIDDLPPELTGPASDGVATVSVLQSEFPATARAALALARASGVDAGTGGVGGFLKRQLGARSVAPREGDDPDAILSRAEAAVRDGHVGDALSELDALPPEVQSAMEDWLAQARTRAGAEQAVQDLSERLTAN